MARRPDGDEDPAAGLRIDAQCFAEARSDRAREVFESIHGVVPMISLFARPFPHCTLSAGQWQFGTPLPPSLGPPLSAGSRRASSRSVIASSGLEPCGRLSAGAALPFPRAY